MRGASMRQLWVRSKRTSDIPKPPQVWPGLIKAVIALEAGIIPPVTGCHDPMPEVSTADRVLRIATNPLSHGPSTLPGGRVRKMPLDLAE